MIYFYTDQNTESAQKLQELLGAKRLIKHDGMAFVNKGRPMEFAKDDAIVCWGKHVPQTEHGNVINSNLRYVDQLQLNLWLQSKVKLLGLYATGFQQVTSKTYNNALQRLENKALSGQYVAFKEFPNRCSTLCKFTEDYKIHVIGGKVVRVIKRVSDGKKWFKFEDIATNGTPHAEWAPKVVGMFGLDFATVYLCHLGTALAVRKILSAPPLDAEGLKLYSNYIFNLVKHKTEIAKKETKSIGEKIAVTEG